MMMLFMLLNPEDPRHKYSVEKQNSSTASEKVGSIMIYLSTGFIVNSGGGRGEKDSKSC